MFVYVFYARGINAISNCPSEARDDVWLGSGGGDFGEPYVDGDAVVVQGRRLQNYPGCADDYSQREDPEE